MKKAKKLNQAQLRDDTTRKERKSAMWTIKKAKKDLPPITVEYDGELQKAFVYGRLRKNAQVVLADKYEVPFDLPWRSVVECLNGERLIQLDVC